MNSDNRLVSIIMPSYNSEKYIETSIRSVVAQTYTDWELIIVDDCSTDGTEAIIRSFSDDSRIRFLKNEKNSGAAVSRNYALREAKGKWIAFLDSDDVWLPEKLEKQVRFMEETGYAFTFTDYWTRLNGEWLPYISTAPDKVGKGLMNRYVFFSTITVMYEREKIGLIQIEPVRHNNDYAMWLAAVEKCKCYRLPECLSYYIRHDNSVSSGRKTKQLKNLFTMWRVARGKSSFVAAWLTLRNMFWFLIRRSVFKRNPDPSDEEAKRMFETSCAV